MMSRREKSRGETEKSRITSRKQPRMNRYQLNKLVSINFFEEHEEEFDDIKTNVRIEKQ
jgi:hypothetical protein